MHLHTSHKWLPLWWNLEWRCLRLRLLSKRLPRQLLLEQRKLWLPMLARNLWCGFLLERWILQLWMYGLGMFWYINKQILFRQWGMHVPMLWIGSTLQWLADWCNQRILWSDLRYFLLHWELQMHLHTSNLFFRPKLEWNRVLMRLRSRDLPNQHVLQNQLRRSNKMRLLLQATLMH